MSIPVSSTAATSGTEERYPRSGSRLRRWLFTALLAFWAFNALAEFFFHGRNFVRRLRARGRTPR